VAMLLMRFKSRITSEIADRDEKEHVQRLVVDFGPMALAPLREYVRREDEIRFPLMALSELASAEECVETAVGLLVAMGIPNPRQRSKALQLLQYLEDHRDTRIAPAVLPILREDSSDDMRVAAATVLGKQEESDEIRTTLLEALVGEDESLRLRNAIIEILAETGWGVQGYRKKVEALLPEGYQVDRAGVIKKALEVQR
jgi:HEAT repeat protein